MKDKINMLGKSVPKSEWNINGEKVTIALEKI
jgi:hypothetical protein